MLYILIMKYKKYFRQDKSFFINLFIKSDVPVADYNMPCRHLDKFLYLRIYVKLKKTLPIRINLVCIYIDHTSFVNVKKYKNKLHTNKKGMHLQYIPTMHCQKHHTHTPAYKHNFRALKYIHKHLLMTAPTF